MDRRDWMLPPPGYAIADIMDETDAEEMDVSEALGLRPAVFRRLLNGQHPISAALASRLADVLGSSADFWIERERQFRASEAQGWPDPWATKGDK